MRRKQQIASLVAAGALLGLATGVRGDGLDVEAFRSLAPAEQLDFVVSSLQERERHLQALTVRATEVTSSIGADAGVVKRQEYTLRTRGPQYYIESTAAYPRKPHLPPVRYQLAFDGEQTRVLEWRPKVPPLALIDRGERRNLEGINFLHLAGIRVFSSARRVGLEVVRPPRTLAQWVEDVRRESADQPSVRVRPPDEQRASLVELRAVRDEETHVYVLDPQKAFAITSFELEARFQGTLLYTERHEVTETVRVGEAWVPKRAERKVYERGDKEASQAVTVAVAEVTAGVLSDRDMAVTFPPDAQIFDKVEQVVYRDLGGGKREYFPLYDPATNTTTVGGKPQGASTRPAVTRPSGE